MQRSGRRLDPQRLSTAHPVHSLVDGRRRLSRPLAQALPADKPYFSAWTPNRSRTVAKLLAGQLTWGAEPEAVRHDHNAIFRLGDVVAKIANPEYATPDEVQCQLDFARTCHDGGAPVLAPLEPRVRIVTQGGEQFAATLWPHIPEVDKPADGFAVGEAFATMHQIPLEAAGMALKPVDPCGLIAQRLALIEPVLTESERALLHERLSQACELWRELVSEHGLRQVPIHLNYHRGSITASPLYDGTAGPWIFDMEHSGIGPPEADLHRVQLGVDRFGAPPRTVDDFRAGYACVPGAPELSTDPAVTRKLRGVWEPLVIAERCSAIVYNKPALEAELHVRVASLRYEPGDPAAPRWTHQAE